jgi:multidrug efflux pump subunit AcrB
MSLTSLAVDRPVVVWFATGMLVVAGIVSYFSLGQLEDPDFTVKTASVITAYPGASPEEVEHEVTDRLEQAVQEMAELKHVSSLSRAGLSILRVDIRDQVPSRNMSQTWDVLRKKIRDAVPSLPPGAREPQVGDDFGSVYGFVLGISGDGFDYAQLEHYADLLKKELALVKDVARVEMWGVQQQCVYVDVAEGRMAELGLRPDAVRLTLRNQNMVVDAGAVDIQTLRPRFEVTGAFKSPRDIGELMVEASPVDPVRKTALRSRPGELIRLKDAATVRRGYVDPPKWQMRLDGEPALALAITHVSGSNIVKLGQALDARLAELLPELPVGVELHRVAWQSDLVRQSIRDFTTNLLQAVGIVLIVVWFAMGFRSALIIGMGGMLLVILGTFVFMAIAGIDLHRISLGALVIAMGDIVDNAIVVVHGFGERLRKGLDRKSAAIESASRPALPLLSGTVIAVMGFYPIFASPMNTGEFAGSLFTVFGAALVISWVLAMTVLPLMCMAFIPDPTPGAADDAYSGRFYSGFRNTLAAAIRQRFVVLAGMVGLLLLSIAGFSRVNVLFFPDSTRTQFMIDYWAPEGTRLEEVSAQLKPIEDRVRQDPAVRSIATFLGQGPPRFYLPVDPEWPYPSYAQMIVSATSAQGVKEAVARLQPWLDANVPLGTTPRVRVYAVGPSNTWKLEARFSGPGTADAKTLLAVADKGVALLRADPAAKEVRTNWREPVWKVELPYDESRGRWVGISRDDVAASVRGTFDGIAIGLYREGDNLLPIIVRNTESGRANPGELGLLPVRSSTASTSVPLAQVLQNGANGVAVHEEHPIIWRWDRRRAVTVQCSPNGVTAATLRDGVLGAFDAIPLPPGYRLEWGGEHYSSKTAQEGLLPGVVPALAIMALIVVALFNSLRPPIIIVLTIPFALIGITAGLLITGAPFGFMALLGAMSLSGVMIKNAIVLLDQIPEELAAGKTQYQAVIDAALSRLKPVANAASTTVLGMIPLLQDPFWVGLSVTVIFGLAFGALLTMFLVPILYATLYRMSSPKVAPAPEPGGPPDVLNQTSFPR